VAGYNPAGTLSPASSPCRSALAYVYFEDEPRPEPPNDGARGRGGVQQSAASFEAFLTWIKKR
jgi:hypothetical protein